MTEAVLLCDVCPALPLSAGGLPYGWVSTNKVFSQLKFLDLSQNNLGLDANGQQYKVTEVSHSESRLRVRRSSVPGGVSSVGSTEHILGALHTRCGRLKSSYGLPRAQGMLGEMLCC